MSAKESRYQRLFDQLKPLLLKSPNLTSQLSTINAVLYHKISYSFWVGFYFVRGKELVVGPYQGPLACQVLPFGKGVCWHAVQTGEAIIVANVHDFPGHIACDSRSVSEIVIPIKTTNNQVIGVLDIDSDKPAQFDSEDTFGLEQILSLLNPVYVEGY